jgi:hypothetical protein
VIAAVLLGLLVITASCGDLQDPVNQPAVTTAELIDAPEGASENSTDQKPNGRTAPGIDRSALARFAAESQGETRPVTLGWDPSSSEGVLGYKVHLIAVSTGVEHTFDVGPAIEVSLPLVIHETYGFTVTAYNASMESQALPYMLFHVFPDAIG